jgi:hypothetical protein
MSIELSNPEVFKHYQAVKQLGSKEFIRQCLTGEYKGVKKPWSFVKACFILNELEKGNRPHIGMAFGFDAKCSGPQLAALTVGDSGIAQACGWTDQQLEDAYQLCTSTLAKAGFTGISRNGIKKAYMGIFYGQGYAAFLSTTTEQEAKEAALRGEKLEWVHEEIIAAIGGCEKKAKQFHKIVNTCFGKKVGALRNQIKSTAKETQDLLESAGYYGNINA